MEKKIWTGVAKDGKIAVNSCGFLVFRRNGRGLEFLLMKHQNRYDLPKGHRETGETALQTAYRELREETGIKKEDLDVLDGFQYTEVYYPRYARFNKQVVEKTVVLFAGVLKQQQDVKLTEHIGFAWITWNPPHKIQRNTIDPLLNAIAIWKNGDWAAPLLNE
eukprot:TRINITY_DN4457_c0_g1_i1.p1 TRINITY_DN4457_c0_g1~~TRINITY_DN4457_c0_g1_i1.p1  ORF type:complete len:163 (-),score=18.37 TRINITY_DN4457_c0_g1_i1:15-503(-)